MARALELGYVEHTLESALSQSTVTCELLLAESMVCPFWVTVA